MFKKNMLHKKVWAVIGVGKDTEKFGNKIYKRLKHKGYRVYAINPLFEIIEGDKCYKDLSSLPEIPEVINMVVSPERGKQVIEEAAKLGIKYVWFQPGSSDANLLALTAELGIESVQTCVLRATE
jgi:predicted CoA-binding protein